VNIAKAIFNMELSHSKGEARRLVLMNVVKVNNIKVNDIGYEVRRNDVIEIGKTKKAIFHEKKDQN
jgi:ribosomal protein S4